MAGDNYLIISDLQIPFEAERALEFCTYVKRHFKIADDHCICVGDEVDNYWGSLHKKGADFGHTPNQELEEAKDKLRQWYSIFPKMMVAESNHGTRWIRKASDAEIPTQLIRDYREYLECPPGWQYKEDWRFLNLKNPFRVIHGTEYSGENSHKNAVYDSGISTAHGHLFHAGIEYIRTKAGLKCWGMSVACLIDVAAYAFFYKKNFRKQPSLGAGVVLNSGQMPIWIPYEQY